MCTILLSINWISQFLGLYIEKFSSFVKKYVNALIVSWWETNNVFTLFLYSISTLSYTLFNVSSTGLKSKDDFLSEYSCEDLISSMVFPIQLLIPVHSVRLFEKKIGIFKISEIIEDVSRALNRGDVIIFSIFLLLFFNNFQFFHSSLRLSVLVFWFWY